MSRTGEVRSSSRLGVISLAAVAIGCGAADEGSSSIAQPIVYGEDQRAEYYQSSAEVRSLMQSAVVALVPTSALLAGTASLAQSSTYAEKNGLCAGERFADQPAAAFCSGVLMDWDLVLTAGHCLRAYALEDFRVVFDYYYEAGGKLAVGPNSIASPIEIVDERLDEIGDEPRIDYGWLRLERRVGRARRPASFRREHIGLLAGDNLFSLGASGGLPLKVDPGMRVVDARAQHLDWFSATADVSHGDSGGGAFDAAGVLVGNLSRGGSDFVTTEAGCQTTAVVPEGAPAEEQYTYVQRAVEGLCRNGESSLCRKDCEEPCQALPLADEPDDPSCSVVMPESAARQPRGWLALLGLMALGLRRAWVSVRSNRTCRPSGDHR